MYVNSSYSNLFNPLYARVHINPLLEIAIVYCIVSYSPSPDVVRHYVFLCPHPCFLGSSSWFLVRLKTTFPMTKDDIPGCFLSDVIYAVWRFLKKGLHMILFLARGTSESYTDICLYILEYFQFVWCLLSFSRIPTHTGVCLEHCLWAVVVLL